MDLRKAVPAAGSTLYLQDDVDFFVRAPDQIGGFLRRTVRRGVGVAVFIPLVPLVASVGRADQARGLGVMVTTPTGEVVVIEDAFLGAEPPDVD